MWNIIAIAKKAGRMASALCIALGRHTPFINSLLSFRTGAHKQALPKFLVLWVLSSLPVFFAILLSKVPAGTATMTSKFGIKLRESLTVSESFVYAAGFISPVLYLIIQRYLSSSEHPNKSVSEQIKRSLHGLFRGYVCVWVVALLILVLTAVAFAAEKTDPVTFKSTFLGEIVSGLAPVFYVFSLFCWYLTLCDDFLTGFNYPDAARDSEDDLSEDFSKRIQQRGGEQ